MKTRREFLLGTAGVAVLGAAAVTMAPSASSACAAIHERLVSGYAALSRDTHFALNSVLTAARDIYCPYCGEPVVKHV